jgi:hypothetical protein
MNIYKKIHREGNKKLKVLNDKMTFRGFYSDERGGFRPKGAPPSVFQTLSSFTREMVIFIG